MKTYSVKHIPYNKGEYNSVTTVPEDLMIPVDHVTPYKWQSGGYDRWACSKMGFYIDVEQFKNYKTFYLNYNSREVCFINFTDSNFINSCKADDYKMELSTLDWTLVYADRDKYDNYQLAESKNRVFLSMPSRKFTKASVKLFLNKSDMHEYQEKLDKKRDEKRSSVNKLMDNTNNGEIVFSTPPKTVAAINKPTDHVKGLLPGDIIYGVIKCLNDKGESVLNVSSTYVNYIDVYVNGTKVNTLPMSVFGDIMSKYIVLSD